jgi:hypothetical protein
MIERLAGRKKNRKACAALAPPRDQIWHSLARSNTQVSSARQLPLRLRYNDKALIPLIPRSPVTVSISSFSLHYMEFYFVLSHHTFKQLNMDATQKY